MFSKWFYFYCCKFVPKLTISRVVAQRSSSFPIYFNVIENLTTSKTHKTTFKDILLMSLKLYNKSFTTKVKQNQQKRYDSWNWKVNDRSELIFDGKSHLI